MTISLFELLLYAGGLLALFLTPGPVWVAMLARSMSGGFNAAWPLAIGVAVGDVVWPLVAVLGITWIVAEFTWFMDALRWVAVVMFLVMGALLILNADKTLDSNSRLTRPGMAAGFMAGVAVILANPKAVLFYMGVLPGFFDLSRITTWDIVAICALSVVVPLLGNLILGLSVHKVRGVLKSPSALRRMNVVAGWLLIAVGLVIAIS